MLIPEAGRTIAKQWVTWKEGLLGEALKGVRVEEGAGTPVVQYLRELRGKANIQQTEFGWSDDEWQEFLKCPPVVPLGYNTRKERVSRTMEIVPFVSGCNVRLLESPLSQTWLSGLMGFPNMVHDDETQAFYAAVNPFVSILDGKRVIDQGQRELGRNKVPEDAEYD
jgi:hypothetical protein